MARIEYKYFLDINNVETEVTKEQYVATERLAGFNNTMGQPLEPATSAFSGRGLSGREELIIVEND